VTTPHHTDEDLTLYLGDCLDVMRTLPDNSVDAVVTDPPYGLGFMGREWDALPPGREWAEQCLRLLKPGGHMLAFGGTRTWHRLACAVEDAGFEVRDSIAWLYGSGFPKSLDVSKAINKAAGAVREVVGHKITGAMAGQSGSLNAENGWRGGQATVPVTAPATDAAREWQGWGTALKPAFEPVVCARKPLVGTVAANVQQWGTGALNIDGCRVGMSDADASAINAKHAGMNVSTYDRPPGDALNLSVNPMPLKAAAAHAAGRWPANVVFDETQAAELDRQSGVSRDGVAVNRNRPPDGSSYDASSYMIGDMRRDDVGYGGAGGASRFFPTFHYEAKAPTSERPRLEDGTAHATVKPVDLMRWLVRLVTPPGGTVLEPFLGSGTTAEACIAEGFRCIGIERDETYMRLVEARLSKPIQRGMFG
jgi:hypothetical protein